MFGFGKRTPSNNPYASSRDRERAARRREKEQQAAAKRRAGYWRNGVARSGRQAEQWEQQDRRRFGGGA